MILKNFIYPHNYYVQKLTLVALNWFKHLTLKGFCQVILQLSPINIKEWSFKDLK